MKIPRTNLLTARIRQDAARSWTDLVRGVVDAHDSSDENGDRRAAVAAARKRKTSGKKSE